MKRIQSQEDVILIKRNLLFGNPDKILPTISPDGSQIAYIAPLDGFLNIWLAPMNDLKAAVPVTQDRNRGIMYYFFAYTNRHILYLQDKDGDENHRIYCLDLQTRAVETITSQDGIQAKIESVSPEKPCEIVIGVNDRNPQFHDLYLVNIETGEKKLLLENPGFLDFVFDMQHRLRFGMKVTPKGNTAVFQCVEKNRWEPFFEIDYLDSRTTHFICFDQTGDIVYLKDSRDRNTSALKSLNLRSRESKIIASDDRVDVHSVMLHPTKRTVQAVSYEYERSSWKILDESIEKEMNYLLQLSDGEFHVVNRSLDDRHWLVVYGYDDAPLKFYHYDRLKGKEDFLFSHRRDLDNQPLVKMHPVIIRSRDGWDLVSYLSLPLWSDPEGNGKPDKPVPMVLNVHGGPHHRDSWIFHPEHQWLANRGYAVLSVNFRASTGFGKKFVNASNREWGGKMHDDLIDAVEWAIAEKICDPDKIAIFGGSYGGYAALIGITLTPEVFAAAVDIVGPSNLISFLNSFPPYWQPAIEASKRQIGDPDSEEGRDFLRKRSPITFVDFIKKPLLIGHGANDPRVKQAESEQIVDVMKSKGIPVTYILYPDEGHGFEKPWNRLSFYSVAEAFLAQHLHGRFEEINEDFVHSSITVPEGSQYIPGLAEALEQSQKASKTTE